MQRKYTRAKFKLELTMMNIYMLCFLLQVVKRLTVLHFITYNICISTLATAFAFMLCSTVYIRYNNYVFLLYINIITLSTCCFRITRSKKSLCVDDSSVLAMLCYFPDYMYILSVIVQDLDLLTTMANKMIHVPLLYGTRSR